VIALKLFCLPELSSTGTLSLLMRAAGFDQSTVVWANGFGGGRIQNADGADLGATSVYSGAALGLDRQVWPNLRIGAFLGGGFGQLDVDQDSQRVDTDYVAGGLYGQYTLGARFFDFTLFGGTTHNASTRQVVDNLAASGIDSATASYNGGFISPELAYGWHIPAVNGAWTWTTVARLRYVGGWFDGYSETGSAQNLTVNARSVQDLEGRLELALATTRPFGSAQFGLQVNGGVIGLTRLGDHTVDVNLIGQGLSFATSGGDNAVGIFSGIQFDYKIKQNVNAFVSVEGQTLSDSSLVGSARGGVEIRF
jgi:outer membrane autotransporter protein